MLNLVAANFSRLLYQQEEEKNRTGWKMKRREHRELLMSGDLRRGKLEVSPLVARLVLSFSPSCLCLYLCPFRDLDFIPMHTGFSWCLVLFLRFAPAPGHILGLVFVLVPALFL